MTGLDFLKERLKEAELEKNSDPFYRHVWRYAGGISSAERKELLQMAHSLNSIDPVAQMRYLLMRGMFTLYYSVFDESQAILNRAREGFLALNDAGGLLAVNALSSTCYRSVGQLDKAQETINSALSLAPEIHSGSVYAFFVTVSYYQAGELNVTLKNYEKSIELFKRGMEFTGSNPELKGRLLSGMGGVWMQLKELEKALACYTDALEALEHHHNPLLESKILADIGNYYLQTGNTDIALEHLEKSLSIRLKHNYINPAITSYIQLAELYFAKNETAKAIAYGEKAAGEAEKLNVIIKLFEVHAVLSKIYESTGRHDKALEHFKKFHHYREEVHNQEVMRKVEQLNSRHKVERMEQEKEIFRLRNVELKSALDEIRESIRYAQRIQDAILPPKSFFKKYFPESFIVYQPRDIVAGDFYWMSVQGKTILLAACDCTGHGVPGAMVSVVCHNALNRVVNEFKKTVPGEILDKACDLVIGTFSSSPEGEEHHLYNESGVKDGMDVALCAIEDDTLLFSGANNPLWIVRGGELIELKADKQPVGKFIERKKFGTTRFELQRGDCVYLFSDGFSDQFGGGKGKKFSSARLKNLLLQIGSERPEKQEEIVLQAFAQWKGALEQIDDVMLIGIRF